MRPDATAKRYSCGTRELAKVDSKNSYELVGKKKICEVDEIVKKVDAGIDVKTCV